MRSNGCTLDTTYLFGRSGSPSEVNVTMPARPMIAEETATDGIYIVHTSLAAEVLDDAGAVRSYKSLSPGGTRLPLHQDGRPSGSSDASLVHARSLSGMAHAPKTGAIAVRRHGQGRGRGGMAASPRPNGAPPRSGSKRRASPPTGRRCTASGQLLADLATLARNTIVTAVAPSLPLTVFTKPIKVQQRAFELAGVTL